MLEFGDILKWDASQLRAAGEELRWDAKKFDVIAEDFARVNTEDLLGAYAESEARERRALVDDASDLFRDMTQAGNDLLTGASAVEDVARKASEVSSRAARQEYSISYSGEVEYHGMQDESERKTIKLSIEILVDLCIRKGKEIVSTLKNVYESIERLKNTADWLSSTKQAIIHSKSDQAPKGEWNAEQANDWWTSRSHKEQEDIINNYPDWVGNLDGIPFKDRDRANRKRLLLMKESLGSRRRLLEEDVSEYKKGNRFRDPSSETKSKAAELANELERVKKDEKKLEPLLKRFSGPSDGRHSLTSFYLHRGDQLQASIGIGDVDNADHVMVYTPGMTSTVSDSIIGKGTEWGKETKNAENVLREANKLINDDFNKNLGKLDEFGNTVQKSKVAAIVTLDYDAPQWDNIHTPSHSVLSEEQAEKGGKHMSSLYDGIQAVHRKDPHLVATGHSYGSTTMGNGLSGSTAPDEAIGVGSPGLGTNSSSKLNMFPGHVYIGSASGDMVAGSSWFGDDPSLNPFFKHFNLGRWRGPGNHIYEGSSGHSEYMSPNKTSTYNIASILVGKGMASPRS